MTGRTKAEENFIDQYTRKLLVEWAYAQVAIEWAYAQVATPLNEEAVRTASLGRPVFFAHALAKGWLTKREPHRLTAKGFGVAASFLKR